MVASTGNSSSMFRLSQRRTAPKSTLKSPPFPRTRSTWASGIAALILAAKLTARG